MALDMKKEQTAGMAAALNRMLTTLEQKVNPAHAALIVVDVQNDFCAKDGYLDKETGRVGLCQAMVPRLVEFIEKARKVNLPIIYIQSEYNTGNTWYLSDVWLERKYSRRAKGGYIGYPVCEPNSWGAEFYDGIHPLPDELIVKKHRYSAFIDTDLDLILRSKSIRTLIMSGTTTSVCVESTARHGFMKDYYIVFLKDCTGEVSEEIHERTLKVIDNAFGEVVASTDVVKCWEKLGSK